MFTTINYLLYDFRKPELDVELLSNFNPMITAKAFSFYNCGVYCDYVNDTLNMYSGIFKTKEDQFRFFENAIPKMPKLKQWDYIKKAQKKEDEVIDDTPIPEFLSKKEVAFYKTLSK